MDQSFADRLARIQSQNTPVAVPGAETVELIGQTTQNALPAMDEIYPTQAPKTYDQRFKMAIVNNLLLGFIWMGITGYIAANFGTTADFLAGTGASEESIFNMRVGVAVGLIVSFALCYWVIREAARDLGKVHGMPASLAVGCIIGVVAGAGPVTVFNVLVEAGYL